MASAAADLSSAPAEGAQHQRFIWALVALVILSLWVRPMVSSLWLDELGTWWVIKDGWGAMVHRSLAFQGQSPFFYSIEWAVRSTLGRSEWILRLPSLAAAAGTLVFVYRLAARWFDRETARLSVLSLSAIASFAFAASDARPYAIATFGCVAATWQMERWLEDPNVRSAVPYGLLMVLTLWAHYLFFLVFVAHLVYVVYRMRATTTRIRTRDLLLVGGIVAAGIAPLAIQLASLWDRRGSLSIPADASVGALVSALVYPIGAGALFLGGLLARTQTPLSVRVLRPPAGRLVLLSGWLLIPPVTLFAISALTPVKLLSPRYFLGAAPAAAIFLAWAVRSLEPSMARRIVASVLAILAVVVSASPLKDFEDWRGAAAEVNANVTPAEPVLLHPALVESAQLDWFNDPERRSYLLSPISYYAMSGNPIPMPYFLTDDVKPYLESVVESHLLGASEFLLVTRYPAVPYQEWLDGRLDHLGWSSQILGRFGQIQVIRFTKVDGSG